MLPHPGHSRGILHRIHLCRRPLVQWLAIGGSALLFLAFIVALWCLASIG